MFKMPKGKYDDKTKLVDGLRIVAQRFETELSIISRTRKWQANSLKRNSKK